MTASGKKFICLRKAIKMDKNKLIGKRTPSLRDFWNERFFQDKAFSVILIFLMLIELAGAALAPLKLSLNPPRISPQTARAAPGDWYDLNWGYRKKITIDHTKVGANLVNFAALVSFTNADLKDTANGGHVAQSDGGDILFTNSVGIKLDHEIEKYDNAAGELVAWVEADSLSSSVDTEIYIYYGNVSAPKQWNVNGAWDEGGANNIKMVQHLKENPAGAAPQMKDSTQYANNGTSGGAMILGDQIPGKIGGSLDFDGADDYVNMGDIQSLNSVTAFTISGWIKQTDNGSYNRIFGKRNGDNNDIFFSSYLSKLYIEVGNGANTYGYWNNYSTISSGTWFYVTVVYNGSGASNSDKLKLYIDGVNRSMTFSGTIPSVTANLSGFNFNIGGTPPVAEPYFNGVIDEVRIYNRSLGAQEISTQYNNQNAPAGFYSIGAEEIYVSGPSSSGNIYGFAWSENIGWISFNSTNCDSDENGVTDTGNYSQCPVGQSVVNYGVNINTNNKFFGYAWSENIGWVTFNESELAGCPSNPCKAKINPGNGEVSGWARALAASSANSGGWDGWIKLRGTYGGGVGTYGVKLVGNEFEGWAWGGDDSTSTAVIGWLSFNCLNQGVCGTSDYKVFTQFDSPPSAIPLPVVQDDYCGLSSPPIFLSWSFNDPGDFQSAYQVQTATNISFSPTTTESFCQLPNPCGSSTTTAPDGLSYGTHYFWRVKVWDSANNESAWATDTIGFITDHAYPSINFSWSPLNPTVGEVVQFFDNSFCYDTAGTTTCSNSTGDDFAWIFQDGAPPTSGDENPAVTFSSTGSKTATSTVTDSDGFSCSGQKTLNIQRRLPNWKEIPPF